MQQHDESEKNVTEAPQDDLDEKAFIAERKAYADAYTQIQAVNRLDDKEAREREDLRIMSTRLVLEVGKLIQKLGDELCIQREGTFNPFDADVCRELLAWQLLSFVSTSPVDRDEEFYDLCPRHYQYAISHAGWWFDTYQDDNGKLIAIEDEDESDAETESQEPQE